VTITEYLAHIDERTMGDAMYGLVSELYPICRSITGPGVRESLARISQLIPLDVHETPSGTRVFDWIVPQEWTIREAWIKGPDGREVVNFRSNSLHVVGYSTAIRAQLSLDDLRPHLHTLPDHPEWIPYRTSYYTPAWGFCLTERQLEQLRPGNYEVLIDATLADGSLTHAEHLIGGETPDEVIVFAHICHPALCNDNLSGVAVAAFLAKALASIRTRYSYRFIFAPATIGSITWLSLNESRLSRIKHGLVAAVLGDPGPLTYKKSRFGNAEIDRAALHTLAHSGCAFGTLEFSPWGYDERQFASPGIALPVGRLTRTPNGCYPEYHTSADNLDLVRPSSLAESWRTYLKIFNVLEHNVRYRSTNPKCEPQLGRRGVYRQTGGHKGIGGSEYAMLWVLNQADGGSTLLDIAERAQLDFDDVHLAARKLLECGLLTPVATPTGPDRDEREPAAVRDR
jgi:aminopeptidase-like protein